MCTGSVRNSSVTTAWSTQCRQKEGRKDGNVEAFSFHVYKYKVSLRRDRKQHRRLELVQKRAKIGKSSSTILFLPVLGHGRYHSMSYKLAD